MPMIPVHGRMARLHRNGTPFERSQSTWGGFGRPSLCLISRRPAQRVGIRHAVSVARQIHDTFHDIIGEPSRRYLELT
jgi:hypothetical protein